ncbi:hypothetical protein [Algibacter lectus]|nr:hypothetical protein [Algibacter lectus]
MFWKRINKHGAFWGG